MPKTKKSKKQYAGFSITCMHCNEKVEVIEGVQESWRLDIHPAPSFMSGVTCVGSGMVVCDGDRPNESPS